MARVLIMTTLLLRPARGRPELYRTLKLNPLLPLELAPFLHRHQERLHGPVPLAQEPSLHQPPLPLSPLRDHLLLELEPPRVLLHLPQPRHQLSLVLEVYHHPNPRVLMLLRPRLRRSLFWGSSSGTRSVAQVSSKRVTRLETATAKGKASVKQKRPSVVPEELEDASPSKNPELEDVDDECDVSDENEDQHEDEDVECTASDKNEREHEGEGNDEVVEVEAVHQEDELRPIFPRGDDQVEKQRLLPMPTTFHLRRGKKTPSRKLF
ncbi:hypothetical protein BT96DRAFT_661531 [Gymnopus androsaceus JB14]|uniref:Uncharacterized protein n=1 Tax=Gymnopus androsaceus JB14 TaxID=1447944 RepID=A0A6A4ID47_9AGAR|nr:hypothetical protein BT96DRAFT_661531 [Gymnopus androsaceus JB14]